MVAVNHLPEISGAQLITLGVGDVELGGYAWWDYCTAPAILLLHGWGEALSATLR